MSGWCCWFSLLIMSRMMVSIEEMGNVVLYVVISCEGLAWSGGGYCEHVVMYPGVYMFLWVRMSPSLSSRASCLCL